MLFLLSLFASFSRLLISPVRFLPSSSLTQDIENKQKPKRILELSLFLVISYVKKDSSSPFRVSLTPVDKKSREYHFAALTDYERMEWMFVMVKNGAAKGVVPPEVGKSPRKAVPESPGQGTRLLKMIELDAEVKKYKMRIEVEKNIEVSCAANVSTCVYNHPPACLIYICQIRIL
jgi:hypothetical protein